MKAKTLLSLLTVAVGVLSLAAAGTYVMLTHNVAGIAPSTVTLGLAEAVIFVTSTPDGVDGDVPSAKAAAIVGARTERESTARVKVITPVTNLAFLGDRTPPTSCPRGLSSR